MAARDIFHEMVKHAFIQDGWRITDDPLRPYRKCIQQILQQYQNYAVSQDGIETEVISDTEHDHYQLVHVGWHNKRRVYGCAFHLDTKDGKIWVQYNGTELHIAEEFERCHTTVFWLPIIAKSSSVSPS
ncbi:hypothetical protein CSB45_09220 [candidate division KSB3 bacterium]|uniref:XisI protein n=1 Tax=candidate division KSB3 bacterium TaxID=2044937 RepID=A0A2G6E432_9BACT|nr:MAG: hypothetical protein CSB45_09220 [candidate division KSB3 bacterium]PIE29491.1 MAG: hypothetical protein CSA57_08855 [candidate division KSB3 bacterium]